MFGPKVFRVVVFRQLILNTHPRKDFIEVYIELLGTKSTSTKVGGKLRPPLRDYLVPLFIVFRVVVFRWRILNTRCVERILKNIKNPLGKSSFLGSRWR